jgi:NhaP-type Na+/H+ or K+/H+ antiporter
MMSLLVLMVTFPVLVGVLVAGWLGRHRSTAALWLALGTTCLAAVTPWIALSPPDASMAERFGAPFAVYLPPLLLAGAAFTALGKPRWTAKTVRYLAFGTALVNVILSQFLFVAGCSANLWGCP